MSDVQSMVLALSEKFPGETAAILESRTPQDVGVFLSAAPATLVAPAIARMAPALIAASLTDVAEQARADVLGAVPPAYAASVLRALDPDTRQSTLASLPQSRQLQLRLMLRHPSRSVAAWTDTSVQPVPASTDVDSVRTRWANEDEQGLYIYAIGDDQRYRGSIALADLLSAAAERRIEEVASGRDDVLRAGADLERALGSPLWDTRDELPVVDADGRFAGAIRYATLRRARTAVLSDDGATDERPGVEGAMMNAANLYYIAMADMIDSAIGRHEGEHGQGDRES